SRVRAWLARRVRRVQEALEERATTAPGAETGRAGIGAETPPPVVQPSAPSAPEIRHVTLPPPGPAPEAAAAEQAVLPPPVPPAPTPLLLNRALQWQDAPFRVFGWIQNSFTGNANGTPRNHINFGVFPNHLANSWMGNQYYVVFENPLNLNDTINFGYRIDTLFGHDWQFTKAYGLFDGAWPPNYFAGVDLPQMYGEVHLPILTPRGLDIRGGRFYSLTGFESPQAIARPLLSVPYTLNFTPFTFFGAVGTLHINERINLVSGTVNGFDRWINRHYHWGYLGALTWTSRNQKLTLVIGGVNVPDQLPRFPARDVPYLPVGVPFIPSLAGQPNPFYSKSFRAYVVGVLTYKWTAKLTQAVESAHVWDPEILGFGQTPLTPNSAAYHSIVNWFLYDFHPKVTGVWRSEIFWDPYGLATGVADNFHEMTLGLNIRPKEWFWIRPEARYDWAQFTHPYNDGTRKSQLTLAFDVIFLF
ncbi:MAG: outer membrane beta-barrel protein, partial [Isosphaeraceae bacterium]|nr:outer membrane beta-barrel protein [Isosphaeraceae bacterium]